MKRSVWLNPNAALAQGAGRVVYAHPDRADALIKVSKPRKRDQYALLSLRLRKRRFGCLRSAFKEYEEYIAAMSRLGRIPSALPAFRGFVDTNLGIGMVVEKITDADGNLAPSQREYIECHGLTDDLVVKTHALVDEIKAARIVAGDLTPSNIVIGVDEAGKQRLFLVDGTSENTFFRVKTHFRPVYLRWIEKKRRKLIADMNRIAAGAASFRGG